jgi:hypothetical protein
MSGGRENLTSEIRDAWIQSRDSLLGVGAVSTAPRTSSDVLPEGGSVSDLISRILKGRAISSGGRHHLSLSRFGELGITSRSISRQLVAMGGPSPTHLLAWTPQPVAGSAQPVTSICTELMAR